MKSGRFMTLMLIALGLTAPCGAAESPALRFSVSFPQSRGPAPVDGRVLLLLSTDPDDEPRNQISLQLDSQIVAGVTVDGLGAGQPVIVDARATAWPIASLATLKAGEYYVQALLNRYETFHRADGTVVKLAPDRGEGQHWNQAPGNWYSKPVKMHLDPRTSGTVRISLDREIPPIEPVRDTPFVRRISIKSELLSAFWGRPMYLSAIVLVPLGFDQHPEARFPLMVFHDHFEQDFIDFREVPPDPDLKPDYSKRFHLAGYNRIMQEEAYKNYREWIAPKFPRFLVARISHANPYYDDSYAVNSANLGPYGDAINKELIPAIEKAFRGIGQGWARFTYGGSTGGWEALATQIFYPDEYNGAFAACPDPVTFSAFTVIDLYKDENAYEIRGPHQIIERPAYRDYLGEIFATQRGSNRYELALGDHGRSGEQYDIWQAVFGPVGPDGYPAMIFDKITGRIDHRVADYWREHYDLVEILRRNWSSLGAKLRGKIHLYVGSADNYYLNDAVYTAESTLKSLRDPAYDGEVDYGDRAEHCWNGDHQAPNAYSRLHYNTMYLDRILKRIEATAPPGADLVSWRY